MENAMAWVAMPAQVIEAVIDAFSACPFHSAWSAPTFARASRQHGGDAEKKFFQVRLSLPLTRLHLRQSQRGLQGMKQLLLRFKVQRARTRVRKWRCKLPIPGAGLWQSLL